MGSRIQGEGLVFYKSTKFSSDVMRGKKLDTDIRKVRDLTFGFHKVMRVELRK